jgi:ribosomal subunit interface protein
MQLDIKATGFKLTDAMRNILQTKMDLLDAKVKRFGPVVAGRIEVCKTTAHHKKGDVFHAEIIVRLPGKQVVAEAVDADLYKAFGEAKRELTRQITEYKEVYEDKKKAKHVKTPRR